MRSRRTKGFHTLAEINVTPFVDVMLVLLVIFMITAPLLVQGIEVNLPRAAAKPITPEEDKLVMTIRKDRQIFLEKQEIPYSSLVEKLKAIYAQRSNKDLFLKADREVPYGYVVEVLAEARKAGLDRVGMITQPPEK
ncbi:MAG: protein TolR [Deltaproteobacteria bacterium]|nr:protein TolR [Deltaproteobacteria bacterium]